MVNTAPPGLIGYAIADRADAVQIWEPAYTLLLAKKPGIRTLDIGIEKTWKEFAGGSRIPYLGVGAHADWADAEPGAGAEALRHLQGGGGMGRRRIPDEAAPLLAKGAPPEELKAVAALIAVNERLAMRLVRRTTSEGDRGGLQGRHGDRLSAEHAVERDDLRQADPMNSDQ